MKHETATSNALVIFFISLLFFLVLMEAFAQVFVVCKEHLGDATTEEDALVSTFGSHVGKGDTRSEAIDSPSPQPLSRQGRGALVNLVVHRFIRFYMFVGNALRGVPNGPHKGTEAVPYAI